MLTGKREEKYRRGSNRFREKSIRLINSNHKDNDFVDVTAIKARPAIFCLTSCPTSIHYFLVLVFSPWPNSVIVCDNLLLSGESPYQQKKKALGCLLSGKGEDLTSLEAGEQFKLRTNLKGKGF